MIGKSKRNGKGKRIKKSRDDGRSRTRIEELGRKRRGSGVIDIPKRVLGQWFDESTEIV